MITNLPAPVERWTIEYQSGDLTSSRRTSPSGAVVWAFDTLRQKNARLRTAVDAGCGKGRNSLYLAAQGMQVTALDFTPHAIEALTSEAKMRHLGKWITPLVHDVTEPWPLGRNDIDLVIDTFCFRHITPCEARQGYKDNLLKVLGARGHYLISFASVGDGYYSLHHQAPEGEGAERVLDPATGIESVIFTREHVLDFFAPELALCAERKSNKVAVMHGATYERETYALLLHRTPHRFMG